MEGLHESSTLIESAHKIVPSDGIVICQT